jgi:hypothetical protein
LAQTSKKRRYRQEFTRLRDKKIQILGGLYYERSGVKGQSDPVPEAGLKKS